MNTDPALPKTETDPAAIRELDALVEELVRLSKSELAADGFHREVLSRVVAGLAAAGGAIWIPSGDGPLEIDYQVNLGEGKSQAADSFRHHRQWAEQTAREQKARLVPPHAGKVGDEEAWNPTPLVLALCPFSLDTQLIGAVELLFSPGASPKTQQGYLQFLEVVGELMADFHERRLFRHFREQSSRLGLFEQYSERVHSNLDLDATACQIVNEGRRFIGCDRVSLLVCRGRRCRLAAVSSADTFSRRANLVRCLERLAQAVAPTGEELWYSGRTDELAPSVERAIQEYLDESHARALAILPLRVPDRRTEKGPGRTVGVIAIEQFHGSLDEGARQAIRAAQGHAAAALGNALEVRQIPFSGMLRAVGRVQGLLPKSLLIVGLAMLALLVLVVVPADFQIEARGKLQPVRLRDVFASNDGVVGEIRTRHGQPVREDEVLVVLRKPELDLEFKRIWGELQTARKRLASVEADRLQDTQDGEEQRRRHSQLTAQDEELREQITNLTEQYAIVRRQQSELEVRSPARGTVLTWNLEQLLEARPVVRGQTLMTVADLDGPWQLELRVPDEQVAHVLAARNAANADLEVAFVLVTEPAAKLHGKLTRIALRTEVSETEQPFVLAIVDIDRDALPQLVPGASVSARVACGRRSLGYVWLHTLIDAVRTWLLF